MTYLNPFDNPDLPAPRRAVGKWHDWHGEWEMQGDARRLFFRSAKQPRDVFAVSEPLPSELSPNGWATFWRDALARNEVARLNVVAAHCRKDDLTFAAILSPHRGIGWAREWWDVDWHISPSGCEALCNGFENQSQPDKFKAAVGWALSVVGDVPLPETVRERTALRWTRGDEKTWRRVVRARLTLRSIPVGFAQIQTSIYPQKRLQDHDALGSGWPELMQREFALEGMVWKRSEEHPADPHLRRGWLLSHFACTEILSPNQQPSAHEQLEATLFLREWLRDKTAPGAIERLLA